MLYTITIPVAFLMMCGIFLSLILLFAEKRILNYGPCKIDINSGDKEIIVEGGQSLLSSLAENDIFIPSACGGRGSCAYCKIETTSGAGFLSPVEEPHLTSYEIDKGIRLSCQVKVRENLRIKIPKELFLVKKYKAILVKKEKLTYDILGLSMKIIEPKTIDFKPGQYIQLESKEYKGRASVMRAYSVSSIPSNGYLNLITRKVPDGICTTWIFDYLKKKQEVYFSGPYGEFILSETEAPIIFIAGGSGMAPIWSMLQYMVESGIKRKAIYFFGALTQKDIFYKNKLDKLSKEMSWFSFIPALSDEPEDSDWIGERGLITDVVKRYIPDTSMHEAYLCGSPGMIGACVSVLTTGGMLEKNIYFDKFA